MLAGAESVADRFADFAWVRREIEHVVDQLIGDTEVAAKPGERLFLVAWPLREPRADPAGRGEQRGGLRLDDLEIGRLRRCRVVGGDQLVHLALGDDRRGA